jgi:Asp/Glu/hydantoin racemase
MTPVLLINPNSNAATTGAMCAIAARALAVAPRGWTAPEGPALIATPDALGRAADVIAATEFSPWPRAIIVSAFGDPGAADLSRRAPCPVIGIGAASARAAAANGDSFAVATTTPALVPLIDTLMRQHQGPARYLGCFTSSDDPPRLMSDRSALDAALLGQIEKARAAGAACVIIGGGPLGEAADRLRDASPLPLINPVLSAAIEAATILAREHD